MGSQVVAEQIDTAVPWPVGFVRNVRGHEDPFVSPKAGIWFTLKLPHVDVQ